MRRGSPQVATTLMFSLAVASSTRESPSKVSLPSLSRFTSCRDNHNDPKSCLSPHAISPHLDDAGGLALRDKTFAWEITLLTSMGTVMENLIIFCWNSRSSKQMTITAAQVCHRLCKAVGDFLQLLPGSVLLQSCGACF